MSRKKPNSLVFATLLVLGSFALPACQRMVEKEKMTAIGEWAIAMCKCSEKEDAAEAKSCAGALKQPRLELLNSSGRTQYKLDSVQAYTEIEGTGQKCEAKISTR